MKFFAILAFASVAAAARLDNSVLLPPNAGSSGGDAGLEAPHIEDHEAHHTHDHAALYSGGSRAGSSPGAQATILRYDNNIDQDGYHYAYETSDGTKAEQTGRVIPGAQPEEGSLSVSGSYTYIGDDGQEYTVTYTADENGYRAEGAHLPTPPPIPAEILKSLQLTDSSRGRVIPGAQPEEGSLSVSGSYTYIGDDGQEYTVTYTADENGYRAEGAHLPTPPPIPAEILKSLQLTDSSRGQYDSKRSSYDADLGY